jgi:hypothetical protein
MFKSLFDKKENQQILDRINRLTPKSTALWGKMNATQMLAHCQVAPLVAFGEKKLKRGIVGFLFGRLAKKSLLKSEPFGKNLPTGPDFIIKQTLDFEEERLKLILLVKRFADFGPDSLSNEPHPFFGKLTKQEWDILNYKHLDHHLRQFGV